MLALIHRFKDARTLHFHFTSAGDALRRRPTIRTDSSFREVADFVERTNHRLVAKLYGIKGRSTVQDALTMLHPHCYPTDYFHAVLMNPVKKYFMHIRGVFFAASVNDQMENQADMEGGSSRKSAAKFPRFPAVHYSKFMRDTGDPYVPSGKVWTQIFQDIENSRASFLTEFGEFSNFAKIATCSKAAAWEVWAFRISGVYMREALPPDHFEQYRRFILALDLARQHELAPDEVDKVEILIDDFIGYYKREMYR